MGRVVLHIGTHKTGTTAVQQSLARNRRLLKRHGIIYPEIGLGQPAHHGLAAMWNPNLAVFEPWEGAEAAWRSLARHNTSGTTLLLSSEEFSRANGPRRANYTFMRDALRDFERVDVICLLRDQVSFLQSIYVEISKRVKGDETKSRPLPPWSQVFEGAMSKGVGAGLKLDYNPLYDALVSAFGAEHVRMIPYAEALSHPQGAIGVVLAQAGGPDASTLSLSEGGRANVTGDPLSVWAACQISAPWRPHEDLVAAVQEVVASRFGTRTTLYTGAEIRAVRERFGPANERLAARLPGFVLPWTSFDGVTRRGRLDSDFWIEVARRIHAAV